MSLICVHLSVISNVPSISQYFRWTQLFSFSESVSLSLWVTSQWPASLTHSNTEGRATLKHLHSVGKSRNRSFFSCENVLLSSWRWMFNARWHSSSKRVQVLHLTRKKMQCQFSYLNAIFLQYIPCQNNSPQVLFQWWRCPVFMRRGEIYKF